jgi:predicted acylesterase/phospholipase RssA
MVATEDPYDGRSLEMSAPEWRPVGARTRRQIRYLRSVPRPRWPGYTAFVLSGGGARGALQVGALRALLEHGEHPDVVVGTSIGAWNGAWIARDPSPEGLAALDAAWREIRPAQVLLGRDLPSSYALRALKSLLLLTAGRRLARGAPSLYSEAGQRALLERHMHGVTFDDMRLPLRIIATDISNGRRVAFGAGFVIPAVLASSAIPGVFPPVRIGDAFYTDGDMLDACSIQAALDLGARRLIILAIGHDTDADGGAAWRARSGSGEQIGQSTNSTTPGIAAVLERAAQVLSRYSLERAIERVPRGIEVHLICLSTGDGAGMLDFNNTPAWIERGYETAREYLQAALPRHDRPDRTASAG